MTINKIAIYIIVCCIKIHNVLKRAASNKANSYTRLQRRYAYFKIHMYTKEAFSQPRKYLFIFNTIRIICDVRKHSKALNLVNCSPLLINSTMSLHTSKTS